MREWDFIVEDCEKVFGGKLKDLERSRGVKRGQEIDLYEISIKSDGAKCKS